MDESKQQATSIAKMANQSIGEVVSCSINPSNTAINMFGEEMYPNYYNQYNSFYGTNSGGLNSSKVTMSASVVFELKR